MFEDTDMKTILMLIVFMFSSMLSHETCAQATANTSSETVAADSTMQAEELIEFSRPALKYDSAGKRDPFGTLLPDEVETEEKVKDLFEYEDASLSGIIRTDIDTYALVVDAVGYSHILREGYMVLGGYVTSITDESVYLHIVKYGRTKTIILRLPSSKSTIITEVDGEKVIKKPGIDVTYEQSLHQPRDIRIDDVTIPSENTVTLEEQWFGKKNVLPEREESKLSTKDSSRDSFSLMYPPEGSWVKLPYNLNWTNYENDIEKYRVIVDDSSDFDEPFFLVDEVTASSYLLVAEMGLPLNKKLFWKIIAVDTSCNEIPCRQIHLSFVINGNK